MYTAGSGSAELTFRYALQEGDSADAIVVAGAIALNGGSIADGAGNAATSLSFAPPSTSGIVIDVKSPEIASITPPASGTYSLGDTLEFTALFSEDVTVSGVPSIAITIGSNTRQALYTAGSGSAELTFRYPLQEGDLADAIVVAGAIVLNGGSIADGAGNAATSLSFAPPSTSGIVIDAQSPEIASTTPPASGSYKAGDVLEFVVTFSEDVSVSGSPAVVLTIGNANRQALYAAGSGSSTLVFRYTVVAGDSDNDGISVSASLNLNGGSIKDASGNAAVLSLGSVVMADVRVQGSSQVLLAGKSQADVFLKYSSSAGRFSVQIPASTRHARLILLDVSGKTLNVYNVSHKGSSELQVDPSLRWNIAVLNVDGRIAERVSR